MPCEGYRNVLSLLTQRSGDSGLGCGGQASIEILGWLLSKNPQMNWGGLEQMEFRSAFVGMSERTGITGILFYDLQLHGVLSP